jgi:hypothetical protein
MCSSVSKLETSSSCSSTNQASALRVVWSFSAMARSMRSLICRVTVSSRSSDSWTACSAEPNPLRLAGSGRDHDPAVGIGDILDEAQRVLALLLGLPVEVARQHR